MDGTRRRGGNRPGGRRGAPAYLAGAPAASYPFTVNDCVRSALELLPA
jgi:hypothetical protein